jgi:hypothetical protein
MSGEIPEWIPSYSYYGPLPGVDEDPPNMGVRNSYLMGTRPLGSSFTDIWGVPYEAVDAVGGFPLPKPGHFILDDIRKWRDVIKAPDISHVDWEAVAKEDLKNLPFSRDNVAVFYSPGGGYFQNLMGFMGFTEGLCAMHEEPEEVKELFNYIHSFYLGIAKKFIDYVKPDVLSLGDDTAAERMPFLPVETYRELLVPYYDDFARLGRDRGIPINFHNCGKSGVYFNDLVRIGVTSWEPVQLSNDIAEIQKKFGRHLVIGGGWEGRGHLTNANVTDEEIRESVRVAMDSFAKNGGYMFAGAYTPGALNDEKTKHWNEVLQKEVYDYGHKFYK